MIKVEENGLMTLEPNGDKVLEALEKIQRTMAEIEGVAKEEAVYAYIYAALE